MTAKRFLKKFK